MKKILCSTLAVLMAASVPMAYATPTDEKYKDGTVVEYIADANDNRWYTITVPAKMTPKLGQETTGTVTLTGQWASDEIITITSDTQVVLTNSINSNNTETLGVNLTTMEYAGNNTAQVTYTGTVTLDAMPATALFGTWSGLFNYNVDLIVAPQSAAFTKNAWYVSEEIDAAFALTDNKIIIWTPGEYHGLVKDYTIVDEKLFVAGVERGILQNNNEVLAHNLFAGIAYTDEYTYVLDTSISLKDYFEFDDNYAYFFEGTMTWQEYVESEYNPDDIYDEGLAFAIINDVLYVNVGQHGLYQPVYHNGEKIPYDSLIIPGAVYSRYN